MPWKCAQNPIPCNNNKQMSIPISRLLSPMRTPRNGFSSSNNTIDGYFWHRKQNATLDLAALDTIQSAFCDTRETREFFGVCFWLLFAASFQFIMSLTSVHLLNIDSFHRKICINFWVDFLFLCLFARFFVAIVSCRRFMLATFQHFCIFSFFVSDFFSYLQCSSHERCTLKRMDEATNVDTHDTQCVHCTVSQRSMLSSCLLCSLLCIFCISLIIMAKCEKQPFE